MDEGHPRVALQWRDSNFRIGEVLDASWTQVLRVPAAEILDTEIEQDVDAPVRDRHVKSAAGNPARRRVGLIARASEIDVVVRPLHMAVREEELSAKPATDVRAKVAGGQVSCGPMLTGTMWFLVTTLTWIRPPIVELSGTRFVSCP